jgi:hypothetical protein
MLNKTLPAVLGVTSSPNLYNPCLACSLGKSTRPNILGTSNSSISHSLLEVILSDTQDPFPIIAL